MEGYLRLRQVCLVAADIEREADLFKQVLGLEECYRDPNVARYGLQNVLFPVGTDFLEIVSPTRPGTAAGRFLERHGGLYGYMIIMDCDDPEARQAHCETIGVRTANLIRHENYVGVQLHPKDTGGAMLEFNRTAGGEDPGGPYGPAGPNWQDAVRDQVTQRLLGTAIECPDPGAFAARWSEILQRPVEARPQGSIGIALDTGRIDFQPGRGPAAVLAEISVQVKNADHVKRAAQQAGCIAPDGELRMSGIRVRLLEAA